MFVHDRVDPHRSIGDGVLVATRRALAAVVVAGGAVAVALA